MKIASYNVNGIRAAIKKGLVEWIAEHDFDIIGFQETKCQPGEIDEDVFRKMGYELYWHSAEKKGYSGVLTMSKLTANQVHLGMNQEVYDREGRVLVTKFGDWILINCYFPSGSSGETRHAFKMDFLYDFEKWIRPRILASDKLIVLGDYNIVHQGIDIHNPKRRDNPSGYRPEERAWLSHWFSNGMTDSFRHLHPDKQEFSWWTYRAGARNKNKGWRIDYQSVSNNIAPLIKAYQHLKEDQHSDHCAGVLTIDL